MNDFSNKLYRFQNYINKQNTKNEILLVLFNHYINSYPNNNWLEIQDLFFEHLPYQDPKLSIIYTILTYNLKMNLLINDDEFIYGLIKTINNYPIEPLKIAKKAKIFLEPSILKIIQKGYTHHYLRPQCFFKIVYENYDLNNITPQTEQAIIKDFKRFIETHQLKIFNKNYNFYNIYECLKKLMNLYNIDTSKSDIELLPFFYAIESPTIRKQIEQDFKHIEETDKPLIEKINDCLTIIQHFKYDLPTKKEPIS